MTQLHYNTQLSTQLILYVWGDRTLSPRHIHTNTNLFNPQESVKFDYCDFYKHTPYESRQSMHQRGRRGSGRRKKIETRRQRSTPYSILNAVWGEKKEDWTRDDVGCWMDLLRFHNSLWKHNTHTLTHTEENVPPNITVNMRSSIFTSMSLADSCQCVHFHDKVSRKCLSQHLKAQSSPLVVFVLLNVWCCRELIYSWTPEDQTE